MADEQTNEEKEEQAPKKKSSSKTILFIALGIVLLGGLGGGGYFGYQAIMGDNGDEPGGDPVGLEQPPEVGKSIALLSAVDSFSLKDNRYISFQLYATVAEEDEEAAKILKDRQVQIKDAMIMMFIQRTSAELKTEEGINSFIEEIRERLTEFIEAERIKKIEFGEFLIG